MGRRTAQHVEADSAGSPMVSRRQPAPVAPLLAIPFPTAEGALRGHPDAGLWPATRPSQGLRLHYCTPERVTAPKRGKPAGSRRPGPSRLDPTLFHRSITSRAAVMA